MPITYIHEGEEIHICHYHPVLVYSVYMCEMVSYPVQKQSNLLSKISFYTLCTFCALLNVYLRFKYIQDFAQSTMAIQITDWKQTDTSNLL